MSAIFMHCGCLVLSGKSTLEMNTPRRYIIIEEMYNEFSMKNTAKLT